MVPIVMICARSRVHVSVANIFTTSHLLRLRLALLLPTARPLILLSIDSSKAGIRWTRTWYYTSIYNVPNVHFT
jgi:hypothetical protein